MHRKSLYIALCAIITALTFVFSYFPFVFLIPMILTAGFQRLKLTLFASFIFGIISFLLSLSGGSPVALAFASNPLIPIVPRLFVGLATHYSYALVLRLSKARVAASIASASVASLTNSVLVISALVLFTPDAAYEGVSITAFVPVMIMYGLIELCVNTIVTPPISLAVYKSKVLANIYPKSVLNSQREKNVPKTEQSAQPSQDQSKQLKQEQLEQLKQDQSKQLKQEQLEQLKQDQSKQLKQEQLEQKE